MIDGADDGWAVGVIDGAVVLAAFKAFVGEDVGWFVFFPFVAFN